MKKGLRSLWDIIKGLFVLGIIVGIVVLGFRYIIKFVIEGIESLSLLVSGMDAVVIVALITGAVSILGVVMSSIVSKIIEYKQKTNRYLYEKREIPYSEFIEMVYKIMHKTKLHEEYGESEMLSDTVEFSKKLTLWGSSRVIKKWLKFRLSSQGSNVDPQKNMFVLEDIIFEIRRDMGLKKRGLSQGDLLSFFLNDIKKHF